MKSIVKKDFAHSQSLPFYPKRGVNFEDDNNPKLRPTAVPLHKMLVSSQIDGVSIENSSLLQRQYDEEFGVVDPASDIHTDVHLLKDALMRRAHESKIAATNNKQENTD